MSINGALGPAAAVVAVDVGKTTAAVLVTDAARHRLLGPLEFSMTAAALAEVITRSRAVLPAGVIRVGVEAAGHYHRPLAARVGVAGLGGGGAEPGACDRAAAGDGSAPGEDRRARSGGDHRVVAGRSRAGWSPSRSPSVGELTAWAAHRHRRVHDPDGDEEPAAGSAGPLLPRVDVGVAGRVGHQGRPAGRRSISPTRTGSPRSARPGSSGSPPPAAPGPPPGRGPVVAAARDALPDPGRGGGPAGAGRGPGVAGRASTPRSQAAETRMAELLPPARSRR